MSDLETAVTELCENIPVLPFIIGVGSVVVLTVVAKCLWGKSSSKKSGKLVALADPNTSYPLPLIEFKLPSFEHDLGLQIRGLQLLAENGDDLVIRAHSPVPSDEGKDYVDLVVQVKKSALCGLGGFNRNKSLTNESFNTNGSAMKDDTAVTSSLISSFLTAIRGIGIFGMPPSITDKTKTEITSMKISSSRTDSTVGDSPLETQSVSSIPEDSDVKSMQISSTISSVSTTSTIQNQTCITITAFKRPVSSTSTVQNSAPIAAQSNSTKIESIFDKETEIAKARKRFYSKVKDLNESVSSWIVKQVKNMPHCCLLSIFKEYENYLKEIQEEYEVTKQKIDVLAKSERFEVRETCGYEDVRASTNGNTTQAIAAAITNTSNTEDFGTTSNSGTTQTSPCTTPTKRISLATPCGSNTNSPITTDAEDASSTSQDSSYEIKATSETSTSSAFTSTNTNLSSPPRRYSFGITSTRRSLWRCERMPA